MTHPTISCERFNEQLAEFLERAVTEPMRTAMESHAVKCDDCGPMLADLRRLRIDATNLPELAPGRDLWSGIADRIEAPVLSLHGARASGRRIWTKPIFVSLAAAGLVAITATVTHRMDGGPKAGGPVDRSTGGPQANSVLRSTPTQSAPAVVASAPDTGQTHPRPPCRRPRFPVHRSTGPPVNRLPRSTWGPTSRPPSRPTTGRSSDCSSCTTSDVLSSTRRRLRSSEKTSRSSTTRSRRPRSRCGAIRRVSS